MKKEFGFSSALDMNLQNESAPVNRPSSLLKLRHELAGTLNFNYLTTPFHNQPLDNQVSRVLKRGADILISSVTILAVFSWLIPLMALLIKLDSKGPVFFLQKRNKRNGVLFTCIKFRSMVVNEDADILPAGKDDKRITRIGRFLRDHYIDELPQFFNVFMGDMSLIGPRPHMITDNLQFDQRVKNYACRHLVKPGITGLAQVLGLVGLVDDQEKLEARVNIDIFYVRHWSPRLDLIILLKTIKKIAGL